MHDLILVTIMFIIPTTIIYLKKSGVKNYLIKSLS